MTTTPISPKPAALDEIKATHKTLGERASQAADKTGLVPEAEEFIFTLRRAGRDVPPGSGRDLLRSLASYWATFVYSNSTTGVYPSTELEPYLGPPVEAEPVEPTGQFFRFPVWAWVAAGAVGLLCLVFVLGSALGWGLIGVGLPTENPTQIVDSTEPPTGPTETEIGAPDVTPEATVTRRPSFSPTPLPVEVTPTEVQPPTLMPTATPEPPVMESQPLIGAQVTNLQEGQEVSPAETMRVQYTNLQPGWTLHLVLQPVGAGGLYFPLDRVLSISSENTSGIWNVEAAFNRRLGSQYNVMPVIAISDEARKILEGATENGLEALPEGVITLPQVLTVKLAASTLIDEVRLVYSSYQPDLRRIEIMAARPDGSDVRRITGATNVNKLYPAVSPKGDQIAFVGREFAASGEVQESLWVVGTDGQNANQLFQQPGMAINRPAWSPDGSILAFDATISGAHFVYLYNIEKKSAFSLDQLPPNARFPAWSPHGEALYFSAESERVGTTAIFRYVLDGGSVELVYDGEGDESEPTVSPDGRYIAFSVAASGSAASRESVAGIYVYDLEKQGARVLFSGPELAHFPRWHPQEPVVYFETLIQGSYTIWAAQVDGEFLQQITAGPVDRWPVLGQVRMYLPERGQ